MLALGALLGIVEAALLAEAKPHLAAVVVLFPVLAVLYGGSGWLALWRRPTNRVGAVLVLAAGAWFLAGLGNATSPALIALGQITATLPIAVVVHLVLVYPTGRSESTASRVVIVLAYLVTLVLQIPFYIWVPNDPPSPLFVADRPDLFRVGQVTQQAATALVILATTALTARRYRASTRVVSRTLWPVAGFGILALALVPLSADLLPVAGVGPIAVFVVQAVDLALVPVAFLLGAFLGGYARTGEVLEIASSVAAAARDGSDVPAAVERALGDPSARVLFWLAPINGYVGLDGEHADLPEPGSDRGFSAVHLDGRPVAAIVYDRAAVSDPDLVQMAGSALALELDRQRLLVELVASRNALTESRARIVEADERVRRRFAADLHDGLQGRLVVLAVQAGRLVSTAPDETVRAHAAELRSGLERTIQQLRSLVHDVMPALLVERGLVAATQELVEALPISAELRADKEVGRLDPTLESAAFFVIAEAITNSLKHAQAQSLVVTVTKAPDHLQVEGWRTTVSVGLPCVERVVCTVWSTGSRRSVDGCRWTARSGEERG